MCFFLPWPSSFCAPHRYVVVAEGSYRDELISKIVFMCSRDKFAYLTDFAWEVRVCMCLRSGKDLSLILPKDGSVFLPLV